MSLKKKIVWLPYDMDTAIGINNEGALVFSYELEDTDHLAGGADIYNGQDSVVWNNIRMAFASELAYMYKTLRSTGALSYAKAEQMFEEHQSKWPEAVFNEDSWFKYILPLIEDGDGAYLDMLQGSKAEQRKWWLYNRFRYIDSKYNAGDALSDLIQIRGYAKSNITVTPYADIYPTVKYGSYLVSERGKRLIPTTLICPLDSVNDTEIYIYSASQLASVGDLSGFKVGFANFAMATRLQEIKIGDADSNYDNPNLASLTLGNNVLLKKIDVRNCSGLGDTTKEGHTQQTVDISGCSIVEEVYFDGTKITGLTLPNGGVLKKLHLPATITNLTIMNQKAVNELVIPSYSNISTLRLENNSAVIDTKAIVQAIPTNSRVRLIGFYWEVEDAEEISALYDVLDTMRGLDESGNNMETAQVSGTIHTASLTGAQIAEFNARYPYVHVTADHTSAVLRYYNGTTLITTETVLDGGDGSYTGATPTKAQDAQYTYTFAGWSKGSDDGTVDADALTAVVTDRDVYACFTSTLRTYTVTWVNNGTTIETDTNVPYGTIPHYDGATPTKDGQTSIGWLPDPTVPITGNTTFTAQYLPVYTITFKNDTGTTTLDTQNVVQGGTAVYGGTTPTSSEDASLEWLGWATSANSHTANAVLTNIQASATVYAAFESAVVEVAEITDSWDTIIANIDNGTYGTKYKVGNYKPLSLGTEGTINMQIVGINADVDANDSPIPLTFIGMGLLATSRSMNSSDTTVGGWAVTAMRTYLTDTILPLIPSNVNARINAAKKYSSTYENNAVVKDGQITYDKLWVPSQREIFSDDESETQRPKYSSIYVDIENRIKRASSSTIKRTWWLRSAYRTDRFRSVNSSGNLGYSNASSPGYIALGFCLGLEAETITDDWATILANPNYATDYSIGDTKMIDLGTEGKHFMEIVAFDTDDKADGTGKAGITWISKDLLNNRRTMNTIQKTVDGVTGYAAGGWEHSDMRTYIKSLKSSLPTALQNGIVNVTKVQSIYDGSAVVVNGQTTTDDLWIPSNHEIYSAVNTYESTGATYSSRFTNSSNRTKKFNDSDDAWWLRSAYNASSFRTVNLNGNSGYTGGSNYYGIALGFCTNG